jgi:hypothetical protein
MDDPPSLSGGFHAILIELLVISSTCKFVGAVGTLCWLKIAVIVASPVIDTVPGFEEGGAQPEQDQDENT